MQNQQLTIGAPYSVLVRKADDSAFAADPYVVLVSRSAAIYYVADITDDASTNGKVATWSADVTANMVSGPLMLEVWDSSEFNTLYKREEDFTVARNGAPTPGYKNGNPVDEQSSSSN